MWSDTLLAAERAHVLRLAVWGGGSMLAGTILLAIYAARRASSPLVTHFAMQTAAWGAVILSIAWLAWRSLALRDAAGAVRLDRLVWFNAGLDLGYAGVGATLAITGWALGRRHALVGAGIGILIQGLALTILELHLTSVLARLAP
jgi:hypothetical protein